MTIRKRMIISGRVQSVGFRYSAYKTAKKLKLTGRTGNLPDGKVLLELQGDPENISGFFPLLARINPSVIIQNIDEADVPVVEDETTFSAS